MNLQQRISAFAKLSEFLKFVLNDDLTNCPQNLHSFYIEFQEYIDHSHIFNSWFIKSFVKNQLFSIAQSTTLSKIEKWTEKYTGKLEPAKPLKIGVVMAGNIPFVGFHDFVSVLISGNAIIIKTSSKDEHLPKLFAKVLCAIEPEFLSKISFVSDKLQGFDAVIATGSNNSSRYFDFYFEKYPHIIRKNRSSVAVLTGNETKEQLEGLADDIMLYFGLGCRNVSKVYVPENYDFGNIFENSHKYDFVATHSKYANNYDYNRAIYLVNSIKFLENGFFIIKEDFQFSSPISVLFYEKYSEMEHLRKTFAANADNLQAVVTSDKSIFNQCFDFGKSQFPELWDYEDGVDTLEFLINL